MAEMPDRPSISTPDESGTTVCYAHTNTPTRLRCTRCDRPICGRCAIPASVGQHCPECVAQARREAPRVRSAMTATAPAATALIAITVVFYFLQRVIPGLIDDFALKSAEVEDGELWRLLSPLLVHANLLHIMMNMLVLYFYGTGTEQAFGSVRFVVIYLIGGFFASAASLALGGDRPSVGASGAIFAVVGALVAYLFNRRRSEFVRQHLGALNAFILVNLALGIFIQTIDLWAHVGGFIAGVVLGFGFDRAHAGSAQAPASLQAVAIVAVLAAGAALVALA